MKCLRGNILDHLQTHCLLNRPVEGFVFNLERGAEREVLFNDAVFVNDFTLPPTKPQRRLTVVLLAGSVGQMSLKGGGTSS